MVTTILFDLDGTISDLEIRYVNPFRNAILEIDPNVDRSKVDGILDILWTQLGNKSNFMVIKIMWTIGKEIGFSISQRINFLLKVRKYYNMNRTHFEYLPGAENSLIYSMENYKVGIVTSAFPEDFEHALKKLPLLKKADALIHMGHVKNPKPHPEPILKALEELNSKPEDTIFIGDLPTDIIAGKAANVRTIAFSGSLRKWTEHKLEEENPTFLVHSHEEMQSILKELTIADSDAYNSILTKS